MYLSADGNRPSLDIVLGVFPSKIQYGDVLFVFFEVKNNTDETVMLPSRPLYPIFSGYQLHQPFYFGSSEVKLLLEEEVLYEWKGASALNRIEGLAPAEEPPLYALSANYPRQDCAPNESRMIGTRILWCPQYEFSSRPHVLMNFERFTDEKNLNIKAEKFSNTVMDKEKFVISADVHISAIDLLNPDKQIRQSQFTPYSVGMIDVVQPKNVPLKIGTRSSETRELLTSWFLELPSTQSEVQWSVDGILASPLYAHDSPHNVSATTREEMFQKRMQIHEDYRAFYRTMESRTTEIGARIKRTNEWAEKLLALPDSEVSPHMKEFIVLRGLLVDLRYAEETEVTRDKEFEKIVAWVKTSKYKTLWVLVLKECGLQGIANDKHFSMTIVDRYVKKLAEAFPKEFNASFVDLEKEQSL